MNRVMYSRSSPAMNGSSGRATNADGSRAMNGRSSPAMHGGSSRGSRGMNGSSGRGSRMLNGRSSPAMPRESTAGMRACTLVARAALALSAVLILVGPAAALADQEEFRWRGRLAAGDRVEIVGVNGAIDAVPASGAYVDVRATKRARRSDPASVEIRVVEHDRGVTICAVYPTSFGRRPNECEPGGDTSDVHRNDVRVHFTVEVPAGVDFAGHTVNGDVDVGSLAGRVVTHTVNGDIEIGDAIFATGSTVNGSIDAALSSDEWDEGIEFSTVNGSVTVTLPLSTNADVDIRTVNGSIESDFPLSLEGRIDPRHIRASIGEGGAALEVETVNGRIRLRRSA